MSQTYENEQALCAISYGLKPVPAALAEVAENGGTFGIEEGMVARHMSGFYTLAELEALAEDVRRMQAAYELTAEAAGY